MTNKVKLAIIANILIVLSCIGGMFAMIGTTSIPLICYYTIDSNILCAVASLLYVIFAIKNKSQKEIPINVMRLRYAGTCCLIVTFVVVVTILSITKEGTYLNNLVSLTFAYPFVFHHFICPVLSFISFVYFEGDRRLNKKKTIWWAVVPTLIYGLILIVLNICKVLEGPYPFLMVYKQPIYVSLIYVVAIFVGDYFLSKFVLLLNQKNS